MRDRRDILDHGHFEAGGLQRADSGLTAGTRALDINFDSLEAVLHRSGGSGLGRGLCGERSGLTRAAEAQEMALPFVSVMVTMVLLKEERM